MSQNKRRLTPASLESLTSEGLSQRRITGSTMSTKGSSTDTDLPPLSNGAVGDSVEPVMETARRTGMKPATLPLHSIPPYSSYKCDADFTGGPQEDERHGSNFTGSTNEMDSSGTSPTGSDEFESSRRNVLLPNSPPMTYLSNFMTGKLRFWTYIFSIVKYGSVMEQRESKSTVNISAEKMRGNWIGRYDCTVSLLAAALGLGNLTHFPIVAIKHGAGTFFIPLFLIILFIGLPIFYLEVCLGQVSSHGAVTGWHMAPLFKGTGAAIWLTSALMSIYYGAFNMYPLFYFGSSFKNPLPWLHKADYNTTAVDNHDCISPRLHSLDEQVATNATKGSAVITLSEIEQKTRGVEAGHLNGDLVICLFVVWLLCFFTLKHDIYRLGLIMLFNMLIVCFVLIVLTINGILKVNGGDDLADFLIPDPWKWLKTEIWWDACGEAFFGVLVGVGVLTTLSSYSRRTDGNPLTMAVVVISLDVIISIFVCFVYIIQLKVTGLLALTPRLMECSEIYHVAYVIYPASIGENKIGSFLCIVFFLAMTGLGMTSEIAIVQVTVTSIFDLFPQLRRKRMYVIFGLCTAGFLICLPFTMKDGTRWAISMSQVVGSIGLLVNAFLEVVIVAWVYGVDNFYHDIETMIKKKLPVFWKVSWKYLAPLFLMGMIALKLSTMCRTIWWILCFCPITIIVLVGLYQLWSRPKGEPWRQRFKELMQPDEDWLRIQRLRSVQSVDIAGNVSLPADAEGKINCKLVSHARDDPYADSKQEVPRRLLRTSVIKEEDEYTSRFTEGP